MAPRILIYSFVLGAQYLFYVKSIAIFASPPPPPKKKKKKKKNWHKNSFLGSVNRFRLISPLHVFLIFQKTSPLQVYSVLDI